VARAIVLATTAENAEAILSGERETDHRRFPPKELPARAYLAVAGTGTIVGECHLGSPERNAAKGWALPISKPRRYRTPRPIADFGLAKIPRSFRYVEQG
jgi:predicted transcriptional regulator